MTVSHPALRHARALVIPACLAVAGVAAIGVPVTASAQVAIEIYAPAPPPPLPEYDQPPLPDAGYIWTPGYRAYGDIGYYWVPGTWVEPPEVGLLWTPGYWGFANGRYGYNAGYWGPHVGYYGGIDYGFGYTGDGYFGGEWRNGRFAYNSAVNNFGGVHVTNVYNRTIVRNVTVNRVSFNGPGGIDRRPTPQEANFARERHVQPTPVQLQHREMAARDPQFRNSVNHGHPAIAATPRPAAFPKAPAAQHTAPASVTRPQTARPVEPARTVPRPATRAPEARAPENRAPENRPPENRMGVPRARPATEPAPAHRAPPMRAPMAPHMPPQHPAALHPAAAPEHAEPPHN